jgi:alpha-galactosidase
MKTNRRPARSIKTILFSALAALPLHAAVIPVDLPPPDPNDTGVKNKPVKVYIQSGQSNSLGFGAIESAAPFYSKIFLSADSSIVEGILPGENTAIFRFGVFQSDKPDAPTGGIAKNLPGTPAVALGTVDAKLPDGPDSQPVTVDAFLEVPHDGTYHIHPGTGPSAHAIATVNGTEVYRKETDAPATLTEIDLKKGQRHPIQITFLQGGSPSLWLEQVNLKGMGYLRFVVNELGRFPYLMDSEDNWTVRNDVILNNAYMGKGASKPLSPGTIGRTFGPELGFGYVMGTFHDEPVTILKADIGNRSLGWDILPPGSKRYTFDGKEYPGYKETVDADGNVIPWDGGSGWYAGKQYDDYTASLRAVLDNFNEKYPEYADQGFEVAGFFWFQGHKDAGSAAHTAKYEENLANLIRAWRKEFNAPNAKWAIATGCGSRGDEGNAKLVFEAQLNVADPERHPEFAGNVKTIDTRPFWRDAAVSPRNQGYHYNHNAETYMLVGDALGRAMVELHGGKTEYPDPAMPDKVAALPTLPWLNNQTVDPMRVALRPIVLDKLVPDAVATLPGLPAYRAGGLSLQYFIGNTAPQKLSAQLGSQLDKVLSYYQLVGVDDYNWKPTGPEMQLAEWYYFSFDPPEKKTDAKGDRYRPITLPAGMENWISPDFDATKAGWKTGKAPFGQREGKLEALRKNSAHPHCGSHITPNTLWENEVILIRQKFKMPKFEEGKRYRIIVGGGNHLWSGEGFALFVNGELLTEATTGYYKDGGNPRGAFLFGEQAAQLSGQEVTLAVKAFLRMNRNRNQAAPPAGHLSVWLEEITLPAAMFITSP